MNRRTGNRSECCWDKEPWSEKFAGGKKHLKNAKTPTRTTANMIINISNVPLCGMRFSIEESVILPQTITNWPVTVGRRHTMILPEVTLETIFNDLEGDSNDSHPFMKKSKWTPPCNKDPALEIYVKAVRDKIHRALNTGPVCQTLDNLSSTETFEGSSFVESRSNIVMKPADKCSATVVMSRWDYLDKVLS